MMCFPNDKKKGYIRDISGPKGLYKIIYKMEMVSKLTIKI